MKQIGGPDMEGIGFSLGVERLIIALSEERKKEIKIDTPLDYFIIDFARDGYASYLADKLRTEGKNVTFASYSRALGGAFKMADRKHAQSVLMIENDHRIHGKSIQVLTKCGRGCMRKTGYG